MTLSLNPVSTSNITAARPAVSNCAVAVWDPIGSHVRTGKAAPVRTLSRSSQWEELASPVGWEGSVGGTFVERTGPRGRRAERLDRITTYVVGGLFGLALTIGAVVISGGESDVVPESPAGMGYTVGVQR